MKESGSTVYDQARRPEKQQRSWSWSAKRDRTFCVIGSGCAAELHGFLGLPCHPSGHQLRPESVGRPKADQISSCRKNSLRKN